MIDAVLSHHRNPFGCGVTKFNLQLSQRLGVPHDVLTAASYRHPLVSVKPSEIGSTPPVVFAPRWTLLLHGRPVPSTWTWLVNGAERVLYADDLGCAGTITGNPHRGRYNVLTFGMAHKLALPHFEALKGRLDQEHPDYTISLSTAVHEGSPWDEALKGSTDAMRAIFGDKLRVLGFLADDALAKELQDCDAVACFFEPALRANNTSYWAAVEAGKPVYTNRDAHSPKVGDPAPSWTRLIEALCAA